MNSKKINIERNLGNNRLIYKNNSQYCTLNRDLLQQCHCQLGKPTIHNSDMRDMTFVIVSKASSLVQLDDAVLLGIFSFLLSSSLALLDTTYRGVWVRSFYGPHLVSETHPEGLHWPVESRLQGAYSEDITGLNIEKGHWCIYSLHTVV